MKLEIGPGNSRLGRDWKTLDCVKRPHVDYVARWGTDRLPLDDASCSLVYSAHCLEHVEWYNTIEAMSEVYRILRPGGRVEIWVPDFAYIVSCYTMNRCGDRWGRNNPKCDPMLWVAGRIFAYSNDGAGDQNWHRAIFDFPHLTECLQSAGFVEVQRLAGHERGHRHGPISLGVTARKPQ